MKETKLETIGEAIRQLGFALKAKSLDAAKTRVQNARNLLDEFLKTENGGEYPWGPGGGG